MPVKKDAKVKNNTLAEITLCRLMKEEGKPSVVKRYPLKPGQVSVIDADDWGFFLQDPRVTRKLDTRQIHTL